jgi:arginine deiminase
LHLSTLVAQSLDQDEHVRHAFIEDFIDASGNAVTFSYRKELLDLFEGIEDNRELVIKAMGGVTMEEVERVDRHPLASMVGTCRRFVLDPVPNLYFTRDPFAVIGNGVSINHMYSKTRRRETIFGRYIFSYHPTYADVPRYYTDDLPFRIEGGDIFNLSPTTLLVGISERTTPEAIELLATNCFKDPRCSIDTIAACYIPSLRAYMHLDTVFTQVDKATFVIHPLIKTSLRVFVLTKKGKTGLSVKEWHHSFEDLLCRLLDEQEVQLIFCGGNDSIAAAREQWNDGSNTLCIAPGVVVVYDRNQVTNSILRENGIKTIEIHSSELSRGRGGPRCMSMPFERQ